MSGSERSEGSGEFPLGRRHDDLIAQARHQHEAADATGHRGALSSTDSVTLDSPGPAFPGPSPDSFAGYQILREIHRGGQGVVFQALQKSTNRKVAIKVMKEGPFAGAGDKARFDREVQVLGQLKHPNIVTIHDTGIASGCPYFVMDYISGQPLDVYMASGPRSVDDTLRLFGKICEAVNAAHLRGVIHRDLKPGNIRIDNNGEPHILDFGLAKVAVSDVDAAAMTQTGQFVGSVPWASPEQAEGSPGKIDVRTDVYSLGVILYQMLTGKFPYEVVGHWRDVLDRVMRSAPARPRTIRREINDEVETIVLKCLSKERERRYQTAGECARDVERYLNSEPIEAKRDNTWYLVRKAARRHRVAIGSAAFVLFLFGASFVVSLYFWRQAVEGKIDADAGREQAETSLKFLVEMVAAANPSDPGGRANISVREVIDQASRELDENSAVVPPAVRVNLRVAIGRTYYGIGLLDRAVEEINKAVAQARSEFGTDRAELYLALNELSSPLAESGQLAEAEHVAMEAVWGLSNTVGPLHPKTLEAHARYAVAVAQLGRVEEASAILENVLTEQTRIVGPDDQMRLQTLGNLGMIAIVRGQLDRATAYFAEAMDRSSRTLGRRHRDTLLHAGNLGYCLLTLDRLAETEQILTDSVANYRATHGDCFPATYWCVSNLVRAQRLRGRADVGLALGRAVLTAECGPSVRRDRALLAAELGMLLVERGQLVEAQAQFERGFAPAADAASTDEPACGGCVVGVGLCLLRAGNAVSAEPLIRRGLELYESFAVSQSPEVADYELVLGECLFGLHRFDEAERALLHAHETYVTLAGDRSTLAVRATQMLTAFYDAWHAAEPGKGYDAKAAEWRGKLAEWQATTQPTSPRDPASP